MEFFSTAVRLAIPVTFAASGGVVSERSGVYNIALEGGLLSGALGAAVACYFSGNPLIGILGGLIGGLMCGLILAVLTVTLRVDQFVSGISTNLLMLGLTAFFARIAFQSGTVQLNGLEPIVLGPFAKMPIIGWWFRQDILTYLAIAIVPLLYAFLMHTHAGLNIRACGANPNAAFAMGVEVNQTRFICVTASCCLASLGGCFLVLSHVHTFSENISAGKGFIALAAIILGRWNPIGVACACLAFGMCDAAQLYLQFRNPDLPYQAFVALPYIVTILALAVIPGRMRGPASIGVAFSNRQQ